MTLSLTSDEKQLDHIFVDVRHSEVSERRIRFEINLIIFLRIITKYLIQTGLLKKKNKNPEECMKISRTQCSK